MTHESLRKKADTLIEALPYIQAFFGKTIVIKYGGAAMTETHLKRQFAEDIVLMKYVGMHPVIVHGGGPQISGMMKRLGLEPKFIEGVRVTDPETMSVVEMVLAGTVNKEIVTLINQMGGKGVGLTGKDGRLIKARRLRGKEETMGQVGEVASVDAEILKTLDEGRFVPVISPIGADETGKTYNINADLVAGSLAAALSAEKLLILTDVPGILGREGVLIPTLVKKQVVQLIQDGVIKGGMMPKIEAAVSSVEQGVRKAHIIDGRVPHALLLEIFTDQGVGTEIIA